MLKLSVAHLRWRAPLPSSQRAGDTVDPSVAGRIRSDVVATTSPGLSRTRHVWYGEMMVAVTAGGVTRGANGERVAGRTPEFFRTRRRSRSRPGDETRTILHRSGIVETDLNRDEG